LETYVLRNIQFFTNGDKIGSVPEASLTMDLGRIEINVTQILLSNETMNLLKIGTDKILQEMTLVGDVDGRQLQIEKAVLNRITIEGKRGEAVYLRDINILGSIAKWIIHKEE